MNLLYLIRQSSHLSPNKPPPSLPSSDQTASTLFPATIPRRTSNELNVLNVLYNGWVNGTPPSAGSSTKMRTYINFLAEKLWRLISSARARVASSIHPSSWCGLRNIDGFEEVYLRHDREEGAPRIWMRTSCCTAKDVDRL